MATEKRLIDANAIDYPKYFYTRERADDPFIEGFHQGKIDAINDIKALAPTVDAVEVVRCKDCKHYEWNPFDGCEVCTHISGYVRPDFGCVDGERKSNE